MLDDIPQPARDVVVGGGAVTLLGLFVRWLLRQLSRDRVSRRGDRAEEDQISRLEREITRQTERADREAARADQAYKERNEAIERGAAAVGQVSGLRKEVEELNLEIKALRHLLANLYGANWQARLDEQIDRERAAKRDRDARAAAGVAEDPPRS